MWGKKDDQQPSPTAVPSSSSAPSALSASPNTLGTRLPVSSKSDSGLERGRNTAQIGKSLTIKGSISGSEDIYIDGEVEGTIELKENTLTVGPNGKVQANVNARAITILGLVQGNVRASERIEIRKTGSLDGDLVTARIVIEDGAVFRGSIDIVKTGGGAKSVPQAASTPSVATKAVPRISTVGPTTDSSS